MSVIVGCTICVLYILAGRKNEGLLNCVYNEPN